MTSSESVTRFVVIILVVALVAVVSVLLHVIFSESLTTLTTEILAAVLGVVLVVASVGVTIHFQNKSEMERQFRVALFQRKLEAYIALIVCITNADDDGTVDRDEMESIRNHAELIALVGGRELVETIAKFMKDIVEDGKVHGGTEDDSFSSLVQALRTDLAVVEEDDIKDFLDEIVAASSPKGGRRRRSAVA